MVVHIQHQRVDNCVIKSIFLTCKEIFMDFHKDLKDFLALLPCRQVLLYDTLHNEGNSSTTACIYVHIRHV